jgi:hypothetical protein
MSSSWAKHNQLALKRDSVRSQASLRLTGYRFSAPQRLALACSLATLLLLAGVHAVTFEEISSVITRSKAGASSQRSNSWLKPSGRATGTPRMTAAYIASVFQRQGLQPPAGNEGLYVQSFELVQAIPLKIVNCLLLDDGANLNLQDGRRLPASPLRT